MTQDSKPDYQVGDILQVSCAPTPAQVTEVSRSYVSIEWPWGEVDPDSLESWNGQFALPVEPDGWEWSLFRTEQDPRTLKPGDTCLVGIPEMLVRVIDVGHYDPPMDTGRLPRPHTLLIVLPVDRPSVGGGCEEEGDTIELDSTAPISVERISQNESG
ncbi:hypothetical protein [Streptomyces sp. PAN_FS17]|uniref:hypothetical protein n=1 Tax=Streptomyces sp. PAN_FS17 TaxID=1855351 RepID=UPI000896BD75|nr:hypothetical protein [Streptomyces sp. PAN_FS17]SEC33754.1 hypothetical protein SAMN05216482_2933 [Streptomyces sp. PAN_FS17]